VQSVRICMEHVTLTLKTVQPHGARTGAWAMGVFAALAVAGGGCHQSDAGAPDRPTIILITLDTTRADHLGCYGYSRPTSPNIDRLANESLVYDRAIAPGTWTLPSHASLFTGKFATSHGARYDPEGSLRLTSAVAGPKEWGHYRARTIAEGEQTLATVLSAHGYATGAVVAGPWLKRVFGLNKGFGHYDEQNITTLNGRLAHDVTDAALKWLADSAGSPSFLFLNYFDPHAPFRAPEDFARQFFAEINLDVDGALTGQQRTVAAYDAEIRYMDHHVGRLFDGLRELGLYRDAWIIVTADHGELLGEHGEIGHANTPYQEVVHVPLIVKEPSRGSNRGRADEWIQLIDVMPMILDRLGIAWERPNDLDHPILIESSSLESSTKNGNWQAWIDPNMKFIWNSRGAHMLFDLDADPRELNNLFDARAQEAESMQTAMKSYLASLPEPGPEGKTGVVDQKTQDALKSLGYTGE